ncbi:MAG: uracil-DNA glycosylase [Elusimicrobiota bacterium]|nr:uracil-DNA glycosylase [Elusimicrobiota bacterium]
MTISPSDLNKELSVTEKENNETKKISPVCKWFHACPIKAYFEQKKIDIKWLENYCFGDYMKCARYKKEEIGAYHPDNLMCDGTLNEDL